MKRLWIVLFLVILSYFSWNAYKKPSLDKKNPATEQITPSPSMVGLRVVEYGGVEGKTAMEILKSTHNVVTKSSSYGEYVDSIDGIAGGVEGRYWIVYLDSQMATVGADKLMTKTGQKIEWKFETEEENGGK